MAVFRIEKTRDYTVMSNHHLRNAGLSLKSKGLLSMMLSLPEDWNYTTRGLAKICKEGVDAIGAALREDNARLQSKAVYYDLFIDLHHSTNLRTTAKELDVPERRFVRFLLERRFVYRTPSGCVLPYAKSANDGLFCVRDYYRNGHTGSYTLVTPKGKLHFAGLRDLILVTV